MQPFLVDAQTPLNLGSFSARFFGPTPQPHLSDRLLQLQVRLADMQLPFSPLCFTSFSKLRNEENVYPPGNDHISPPGKENHRLKSIGGDGTCDRSQRRTYQIHRDLFGLKLVSDHAPMLVKVTKIIGGFQPLDFDFKKMPC